MEMPKPTEAHRRLERLVGAWTGQERLHPSPWDPSGGPAVGHVENRAALDGFAVIHDYEQERNGTVTYRGHGIYTWDSTRRQYMMHWWDSMGFPPNVENVLAFQDVAMSGLVIVAPTGAPFAMPLAMTMMSGSTPQCSIANQRPPVRPNPD